MPRPVFPSLSCVFQSPCPWFVDRFRRLQYGYFSMFWHDVSSLLEAWSASGLLRRHGFERPVTKVDETLKCVSRQLLKLLQAKMLHIRLSLDNVVLEALMALILQRQKTSRCHFQVIVNVAYNKHRNSHKAFRAAILLFGLGSLHCPMLPHKLPKPYPDREVHCARSWRLIVRIIQKKGGDINRSQHKGIPDCALHLHIVVWGRASFRASAVVATSLALVASFRRSKPS